MSNIYDHPLFQAHSSKSKPKKEIDESYKTKRPRGPSDPQYVCKKKAKLEKPCFRDKECSTCLETFIDIEHCRFFCVKSCRESRGSCYDCFSKVVTKDLTSLPVSEPKCSFCKAVYKEAFLESAFPEAYSVWKRHSLESAFGNEMKKCPFCPGFGFQVKEDLSFNSVPCSLCHVLICITCGQTGHDFSSCGAQKTQDPDDLFFTAFLHEASVPCCPRCGVQTIKDEACTHITCVCSTKWCFVCSGYLSGEINHWDQDMANIQKQLKQGVVPTVYPIAKKASAILCDHNFDKSEFTFKNMIFMTKFKQLFSPNQKVTGCEMLISDLEVIEFCKSFAVKKSGWSEERSAGLFLNLRFIAMVGQLTEHKSYSEKFTVFAKKNQMVKSAISEFKKTFKLEKKVYTRLSKFLGFDFKNFIEKFREV